MKFLKKGFYKKLIFAALLIGAIVLLRFSGVGDYFTLEKFKEHREWFIQMVQGRYVLSSFLYILFYTIGMAFSFPSASLFTLAGGFLFGFIPGAIYSCIGATLGAAIAFSLVRNFVGNRFQKKYAKQLETFNKSLEEDGISFLLFVRLIAVIPFFLINICAGFSNVSLWTFVWTTAVGIIPGSLVYSFAGQQLHTIDSVRDIFSPKVIAAFLLLASLALLPLIIKKIKKAKQVKN